MTLPHFSLPKWLVVLVCSLLGIVVLLGFGSFSYDLGYDTGWDESWQQEAFWHQLDLQDMYPAGIFFSPENGEVIQKYGEYSRSIFSNAASVITAGIGPDRTTLHVAYRDENQVPRSVCIDMKSRLYTPLADDYERAEQYDEEIPQQLPPWDFEAINSYTTGSEYLPQRCSSNSMVFKNDTQYILSSEIESYGTPAMGRVQLSTLTGYTFKELGEYPAGTRGDWYVNLGQDTSPRDALTAYPEVITELKDYYVAQFGPNLVVMNKSDWSVVQSVNLPDLGEVVGAPRFNAPTCGGPGVQSEAQPTGNMLLLGSNYCEGIEYHALLDFSSVAG